jgi:hypothetical protein
MSPASHYASASGNQVEDQDHHGHNQQKVDQAAADMKAESQLEPVINFAPVNPIESAQVLRRDYDLEKTASIFHATSRRKCVLRGFRAFGQHVQLLKVNNRL